VSGDGYSAIEGKGASRAKIERTASGKIARSLSLYAADVTADPAVGTIISDAVMESFLYLDDRVRTEIEGRDQ